MRQVFLVLGIVCFYACSSNSSSLKKEEKSGTIQDTTSKQIDFTDVMNYSYKKAIKRYGHPIQTDHFKVDESLSIFRVELYNIYSKENYLTKEIKIKEVTWAPDSINLITVWYEKVDSSYHPVDNCFYNKYICF
jgi:hypothetical protein